MLSASLVPRRFTTNFVSLLLVFVRVVFGLSHPSDVFAWLCWPGVLVLAARELGPGLRVANHALPENGDRFVFLYAPFQRPLISRWFAVWLGSCFAVGGFDPYRLVPIAS